MKFNGIYYYPNIIVNRVGIAVKSVSPRLVKVMMFAAIAIFFVGRKCREALPKQKPIKDVIHTKMFVIHAYTTIPNVDKIAKIGMSQLIAPLCTSDRAILQKQINFINANDKNTIDVINEPFLYTFIGCTISSLNEPRVCSINNTSLRFYLLYTKQCTDNGTTCIIIVICLYRFLKFHII